MAGASLIRLMLNPDLSFFENTVDPDQLASDEAIWSGSTLLSTWIENTCLQLECCRLTAKKFWRSVVHKNIQHDKKECVMKI